MIYKIKIGIIVSVVLLISGLGYLYRAEIQKGAQQAATIVQQRAELSDKDRRIADLAKQRDAAEQIAAREKARSVEIYARVKDLRDEVLRMERAMEDVMQWADTNLPDALDKLLLGPPDDSED